MKKCDPSYNCSLTVEAACAVVQWLARWAYDLEVDGSPAPGLCCRVVSVDNKLYFINFSLHPSVRMGTGDHNTRGNLSMD